MRYLIAQYVADPFRQEPRNVGVFVDDGVTTKARFVAETDSGQYDGRKLRGFAYPDVYRQWVDYWRSTIAEMSLDAIADAGSANFRVVTGGELTGEAPYSIDDATNYLYG